MADFISHPAFPGFMFLLGLLVVFIGYGLLLFAARAFTPVKVIVVLGGLIVLTGAVINLAAYITLNPQSTMTLLRLMI